MIRVYNYREQESRQTRRSDEINLRRERLYMNDAYGASRVNYECQVVPCDADDNEEEAYRPEEQSARIRKPVPRRNNAYSRPLPGRECVRIRELQPLHTGRLVAAAIITTFIMALVAASYFISVRPKDFLLPTPTVIAAQDVNTPFIPNTTAVPVEDPQMETTGVSLEMTEQAPIKSQLPLHYIKKSVETPPTVMYIPNITATIK